MIIPSTTRRIKSAFSWLTSHRKSSVAILAIVALGSYYAYSIMGSDSAAVRTIIASAQRGSVISRVTGSGQVTAISQADVTSSVSGDIESVLVTAGEDVYLGQALATIEDSDATKAVTNAELAVANAQIAYDKAVKQHANQADDSSVSDIKKAYEKGYDAITNTFIDLPIIFIDVNDIFYVPQHSPYFSDTEMRSVSGGDIAITYKYQAGVLFDKAKEEYDASFAEYKSLSASSDPEKISAFLDRTYALLRTLSAALTGTYSTIDYLNTRTSNPSSQISVDKSQLSSYISKVNGNVTSVSNSITAIEDAKDSSASSELSLKSAELSLSQQKDALADAKKDLANHVVRAPFAGVVSKVPVEAGDKISNNGAVATVITKSQNVLLSFNEVDAAKLKKGQKATLTFDAIDGLSLSGTITEIDVTGTVSQGVVSYGVKISFDTNDERIKPGMTVSASIVADSREGVVVLPSSVIKYKGSQAYVTTPNGDVAVVTGLSSDDKIEIISGFKEGDQYVSSTVSSSAVAEKSAAASLLGGSTRGPGTGTGTRATSGTSAPQVAPASPVSR
jgi:RND family efflux transporter MFP subunit